MLFVNGWGILAHPLLLDQLERLTASVERERLKDASADRPTPNGKLLAVLGELIFRTIPDDPTRAVYRQGGTLGAGRKHWFRAKFGGQRFRLFFRYDLKAKLIIFAWVNDETSMRTYGAKTDAYSVFKRMLEAGDPRDDWQSLLTTASSPEALRRLQAARNTNER